jgi:hypothetical protein
MKILSKKVIQTEYNTTEIQFIFDFDLSMAVDFYSNEILEHDGCMAPTKGMIKAVNKVLKTPVKDWVEGKLIEMI